MIKLQPAELLDALASLAQLDGQAVRFDRRAVDAAAEAIAEAEVLAEGRPEDEPSAILHAFGRRSASFRPVARRFIGALVQAQAVANGYEVDMNEAELSILCARVALAKIDFLELRGWIAARLRPLGQKSKRSPPKRPR